MKEVLVIAASAFTILIVFSDMRLFGLYGFHFNSFVWNLITTEGGIASLGADQVNPFTVLEYVAILVVGLGGSIFLNHHSFMLRFAPKYIFLVFLIGTLSERVIFSVAYAEQYSPILSQADHVFLYQPLTMNSFLAQFGIDIETEDTGMSFGAKNQGTINYPLVKLELDTSTKPYNIIFLVAESLRYKDIYNEQVMPYSVAFADSYGTSFSRHMSGGNGTRQGLFAMFYGLYGNYWDAFLRDRKSPALFDVLNEKDYQYFLYTSAYFTYPEFDKTIFGSVPRESMKEVNDGDPWTRDSRNVDSLLGKISARDRNKPFMGFVFFESTHARYSFPDSSIIDEGFSDSIDYASLELDELYQVMDGMKARYLNSAHYVDSQFERVYNYLLENEMLDNTILIVTGDHGEEFMEKGRWGHNSSFVDEQIHVPLVISHPDRKPERISRLTSHMDIPGTLLSTLGVQNPISDYSLGNQLFEGPENDFVVVASWTDVGVVSEKGKLVIPFQSTTQHTNLAMTKDDTPTDFRVIASSLTQEIAKVISNSRKFAPIEK